MKRESWADISLSMGRSKDWINVMRSVNRPLFDYIMSYNSKSFVDAYHKYKADQEKLKHKLAAYFMEVSPKEHEEVMKLWVKATGISRQALYSAKNKLYWMDEGFHMHQTFEHFKKLERIIDER